MPVEIPPWAQKELMDTREAALRLWRRAEKWKVALTDISKNTDDPISKRTADRALAFEEI